MAIPRYAWWTDLTAGTNANIRVEEWSVGAWHPGTITLSTGRWYASEDGGASDLIKEVEDEFNSDSPVGLTYAVSVGATGLVTISADGTFRLLLADALTTFDPLLLGFTAASYPPGGGTTVTSPGVSSLVWAPGYDAVNDTASYRERQSQSDKAVSGARRTYRWSETIRRSIEHDVLPAQRVWTADEVVSHEAFERFWQWAADGRDFYFTPSYSAPAVNVHAVVADDGWRASMDNAVRREGRARLYTVNMPMEVYV